VDAELADLLGALPAIVLEGPRAVGKTETASRVARTVHRLDVDAVASVARADPGRLLGGEPPVLLDEWQRVPETWDAVRRAVDAGAGPGRILMTGSATPSEAPTHSGAGRIVTVRMRPFALSERGLQTPSVSLGALLGGALAPVQGQTSVDLAAYAREIVASGFPGLAHLSGRPLRARLDSYLSRIVEHDFETQGRSVRRPAVLHRWMAAYAAATSTTTLYETIRDAASSGRGDKPAKTTTLPYRDILQRLWILDPVPAWRPTRNPLARLTGAPKHQLADPALAARLLGLSVEALLAGSTGPRSTGSRGPMLGPLFEALVTLSVRAYAQASEARVRHLRTMGGRHEVDLIVERADQRVVAIEVKLGGSVDDADVKHLRWLRGKLGDDLLDAVVVTTGPMAYRRSDGIAVIPAALLGP